jgi:hypothetical protein
MAEILSIGDLVSPGTYRAHSRFRRAINFTDGSRLVTVLARGADAGPVNIVLSDFDTATAGVPRAGEAAAALRIERGKITLGGTALSYDDTSVYISSIRLRRRSGDAFLGSLAYFGSLLERLAPEASLAFLLDRRRMAGLRPGFERNLARHIEHCVDDVFYSNRLRGIARLKGCGVGLTPSGDDFIAGFLMGLNVLGHLGVRNWSATRMAVLEAALSGNVLTDAFLYLAEEGRVSQTMKLLIGGIERGSVQDIREATERLLRTGATSGADAGVGFYMTVREGLAGRLREGAPASRVMPDILEEGAVWS